MANEQCLTRPVMAAANSTANATFTVGDTEATTIIAWGFGGADTLTVWVSYDNTNYVQCYKDGSAVTISATNNPVTVYGPGTFQVRRTGTTTGNIGVALAQ